MSDQKKVRKVILPNDVAEKFTINTEKHVVVFSLGRHKKSFNLNIITLAEAEELVKRTGDKYLKKKKALASEK